MSIGEVGRAFTATTSKRWFFRTSSNCVSSLMMSCLKGLPLELWRFGRGSNWLNTMDPPVICRPDFHVCLAYLPITFYVYPWHSKLHILRICTRSAREDLKSARKETGWVKTHGCPIFFVWETSIATSHFQVFTDMFGFWPIAMFQAISTCPTMS